MNLIKSIFMFLRGWFIIIIGFTRTSFMTSLEKDLEILALKSQLLIFQEKVENKKIKNHVVLLYSGNFGFYYLSLLLIGNLT